MILQRKFNTKLTWFSETGDHWDKEIEEDVKLECSKYGNIVHIAVDKESQGHVYLKFSSTSGSEAAVKALNGRFFAGKTVPFVLKINFD